MAVVAAVCAMGSQRCRAQSAARARCASPPSHCVMRARARARTRAVNARTPPPPPPPRNVRLPSYALAKTAQQWRAAMLSDGGRCARVSSLMAPGARTASMVHVATLSAALHGLEAFEPLHVPSVTVAAGVMALLLVADLLLPQVGVHTARGGRARRDRALG